MKIQELQLKHFGKFAEKTIPLSDGINILYGENESGKSTIHTFIKSMLFGLERGRGRASLNDTFSQYEPWENSNYYSGKLRFESGGKTFQLSRNFDKYSKKAELFCVDDGETFSVEEGDLEILLSGLSERVYENTVSIGQMRAEPAKELSAELKNFAANYYVSGDMDVDLAAALEKLKERKKAIDREMAAALKDKQAQREWIEQESGYVWRDIHKLQEEYEYLGDEIENRRAKQKKEQDPGVIKETEVRAGRWRIHPIEVLALIIAVALPFMVVPAPWNFLVAIVLFLCSGIYIWNRMKVSKKPVKTESEKILEEITPMEEKVPLERLVGKRELIEEELRDKQIQYSNLQEQLEELDEMSDIFKQQDRKKQAVVLAEEKLKELSSQLRDRLKIQINEKASEIICAFTGGKYTQLLVDEDLKMSVIFEGKKIPIERLSRGTIEQIYLAFRMAVTEVVGQEEYPVILDDTFAYYDDRRLEYTLRWLYENKKQVLIFTCQKREEQALDKMHIIYGREEI